MARWPASSEPDVVQEGAMNVFIVELNDQPGELARVAEAVARKGIDITGFSGATSGGRGSVALLTSDEAGTRAALSEGGFNAREVEVATASLENQPGTLAAAARKLADAGINIEAALPTAMSGGNVTIAFATDQPARAQSVLGGA
jgi:hypothetical protein